MAFLPLPLAAYAFFLVVVPASLSAILSGVSAARAFRRRRIAGACARLAQSDKAPADREISQPLMRGRFPAEQEDFFRRIFNHIPEAVIFSDAETTRIIDSNDAWRSMFGYSREELAGASARELGLWPYPSERESLMAELEKSGRVDGFPCHARRKDGAIRDIGISAAFAQDGTRRCVLILARDISDEIAGRIALRKSEAAFESIFRKSPVALFVLDREDGTVLDQNDAAEGLLGRVAPQKGTYTFYSACLDIDVMSVNTLENLISSGKAFEGREVSLFDSAGNARICSLASHPVTLGDRSCMLASALDITEMIRAQQRLEETGRELETRVKARARELSAAMESLTAKKNELVAAGKLASMGALVSGVAHRLNTPLGNCIGLSSLIGEKLSAFAEDSRENESHLPEGKAESIIELAESASVMLKASVLKASELVSSLEQLTHPYPDEDRKLVDLTALLSDRCSFWRDTVLREGRDVRINFERREAIMAALWPEALARIADIMMRNALIHAFKGREDGTVKVTVSKTGKDGIAVEFADDGRGIDESSLPNVFTPFFTTNMGSGDGGLGLYVAFSIARDRLGGTLSVRSGKDRGTIFTLTLPPPGSEGEATANGVEGNDADADVLRGPGGS